MNGSVRDEIAAAIEVVEAFVARGQALRDAMAAVPALRRAAAASRAAVAALANRAVAGARRAEFVLGGARGFAGWPPAAVASALVLAAAVDAGWLAVSAAAAWRAQRGEASLPFTAQADSAGAIAAVADPVLRFALRHSLPDWFAAAAIEQFGGEADAVAQALAAPAPRTLRANTLVVPDRDALALELAALGIGTRPAQYAPAALHVDGDADLFATAAYRRGAFEQQDEASQLAAALVQPPPGGRVLDLCAGTGGKTLAICAALQNRGVVLATDVHERRLAALRERAARAGAHNVQVHALGEPWPAAVAGFAAGADRILIDAPCTGTGSWRRRPEGRWTVTAASLPALRELQDDLLRRAAALLRPGARLIYATCSLLPAENEQRIAQLCRNDERLQVVRIAELLGNAVARPIADATGTFLSLRPDRHGCDGFFTAVLRAGPRG